MRKCQRYKMTRAGRRCARYTQYEMPLAPHEYRGLTVEGSKTWLGENWPWLVGGAAVVVVAGVVLKAIF